VDKVAERLRRVEDRLERLLASGWRNARAEAADLAGEADALAALGLPHLADRLRAVAAAPGATEALPAIALAAVACRQLRVRLPAESAPPGQWTPLPSAEELPEPAVERLLPLGRMALGDGEAWACVRLRGAAPADWLLVEPLPHGPTETTTAPLLAGLAARLGLGKRAAAQDGAPATGDPASSDGTASVAWHPWLRRPMRGHLRWLARYPLGGEGEVQRCRLEHADWPAPADPKSDALARFRQAVASGKLEDDQPVIGAGGALRLKALDTRDPDAYAWVDGAAAAAFRTLATERAWAIAWCAPGLIAPLALVTPGGLLSQPRLRHLVPGCPAVPL
jgi:hypothetical protein